VVDDDLPALVGFFEDEGEDAVGVAAFFFVAVEVVFADDYGEPFVEGVDLELGEAEGAHCGSGGVVVAVLLEHAVDAAEDLAGDEEGVGGVFVALDEGFEVATVPGGLLGEEDLDDVELLLGGGLELGVLRVGDEGQKEDGEEGKSGSAEAGAEWHEVTSGIKDNVANMGERLGAGCAGGGIQVRRLLTRSESGSMIQQLTVASQESEKYFNGRR
jgi:hypothetical protein